eukprot:5363571-Pleurochrysis_carterae.AAC.2
MTAERGGVANVRNAATERVTTGAASIWVFLRASVPRCTATAAPARAAPMPALAIACAPATISGSTSRLITIARTV